MDPTQSNPSMDFQLGPNLNPVRKHHRTRPDGSNLLPPHTVFMPKRDFQTTKEHMARVAGPEQDQSNWATAGLN